MGWFRTLLAGVNRSCLALDDTRFGRRLRGDELWWTRHRGWLLRSCLLGYVFVVLTAVSTFRQMGWAWRAGPGTDTLGPSLIALGWLAGVGLLVGVVQGWRSPLEGLLAPWCTALLSVLSCFIAVASAVSAACGQGPDCDIVGAPVGLAVSLAVLVAVAPLLAGGWALGRLPGRAKSVKASS